MHCHDVLTSPAMAAELKCSYNNDLPRKTNYYSSDYHSTISMTNVIILHPVPKDYKPIFQAIGNTLKFTLLKKLNNIVIIYFICDLNANNA